MIEVADIFRLHAAAYREQYQLLPSQHKALEDVVRCRTAACGGHLWQCERQQCHYQQYSYHSCGNRHCPKCHGQQTERWLEQQRSDSLTKWLRRCGNNNGTCKSSMLAVGKRSWNIWGAGL